MGIELRNYNRCENCIHWDNTGAYAILSKDILRKQYGDCDCSKFNYENHDGNDDNLIYADYEGYDAGFSTGRNFGWVHWRNK